MQTSAPSTPDNSMEKFDEVFFSITGMHRKDVCPRENDGAILARHQKKVPTGWPLGIPTDYAEKEVRLSSLIGLSVGKKWEHAPAQPDGEYILVFPPNIEAMMDVA